MTKIYTLLISCCLINLSANAQFQKGQPVIGGNIGFSTGKSENMFTNNFTNRYTNTSINPSVGWFSKPNLLQGIEISYGKNFQRNSNSLTSDIDKLVDHSIGINFFSQRFFNLSQKIFFTLKASAGGSYAFGTNTYTRSNTETKAKKTGFGFGAGLAPGLSYRLSQRWLFDASLSNLAAISYAHSKSRNASQSQGNSETVQNNFYFTSSLSNTNVGGIGLGFSFLPGNK